MWRKIKQIYISSNVPAPKYFIQQIFAKHMLYAHQYSIGTEDSAVNKTAGCYGTDREWWGGEARWKAWEINKSEGDKCRGEKQRKRLQCAMGKELLFLNRMIKEILTEKMVFDQKIWKKWTKEPCRKRRGREEQMQRARGESISVLFKEQRGGQWRRWAGGGEMKISQGTESGGLWLFLWKIRSWTEEPCD